MVPLTITNIDVWLRDDPVDKPTVMLFDAAPLAPDAGDVSPRYQIALDFSDAAIAAFVNEHEGDAPPTGTPRQLKALADITVEWTAPDIDGLRALASRHPIIADVRGKGLMIGLKCVGPNGDVVNKATADLPDNQRSAIRRLRAALANTPLLGLKNNGRFLSDLVDHPAFRSAQMTTTLIDQWQTHGEPLLQAPVPTADAWTIAAVALAQRQGSSWRPDSVAAYDLPLALDQPIDFGLQAMCGMCMKCARECPCNAIPFGPKVMFNGYEIWKPDVEKCGKYRLTNMKGSACGRCMKTCPYNREDLVESERLLWLSIDVPASRRHRHRLLSGDARLALVHHRLLSGCVEELAKALLAVVLRCRQVPARVSSESAVGHHFSPSPGGLPSR